MRKSTEKKGRSYVSG